MPLIEFPDLPLPAPGLPDLNRLPLAIGVRTGVVQAVEGLGYFNLLSDAVPQWMIVDDSGNPLVVADSFIECTVHGEQRIATYPVEEGSFASYNKVAQPQELTVRLSCGGRNMSRDAFLLTLSDLSNSLTLTNVATPDDVYRHFCVTGLNYQRRSSSGLSLIVAEIRLTEVRVNAQASYSNTAQPAGNDPQNQGWVCTATNLPAPTNQLTPLQQAIANVKNAYSQAAQSVSTIVGTVTHEATQAMSGVASSLETAVSGLLT